MKIVVTGATGLIGSNLVHKLMEEENNHIIAISRSVKKLETVFSNYLNTKRFECYGIDLSQSFNFQDLIGRNAEDPIDLIYHAASPISSKVIEEKPVDVILTNINSTIALFEGIYHHNIKYKVDCRIIIFSSATVYGQSYERAKETCVDESDTYYAEVLESTSSAYSESKRMIEVITHAYIKQYSINSIIARISYVYGNSYYKPSTAMFSFLDSLLIRKENIVIKKANLARRDNVYITDVINGLLLLGKNGISGEAYNISSNGQKGNFIAIDEIAELITKNVNELCDTKFKVEYLNRKEERSNIGIRLNNDKIRSLGWSVEVGIEDGIKSLISDFIN